MSPTPDVVARQWFEQVWNNGNEGAIDQLMHSDAVAHGLPGGQPLRGPEAFKPLFHAFRAALGDLSIDVTRTVVEGDICTAYCHVTGKHVGDAFGGPATGRPVDFWGVAIVRVKDGRIAEGWNVFDFLTMYQQIGWVKDPVAP